MRTDFKKEKMKKVLLVVLAFAGTFFSDSTLMAQAGKVGFFDMDLMVRAMPGYSTVDSLVAIYEQDSLVKEHQFNLAEFQRLDSTYKADSAAKKPASVLNYQKEQMSRLYPMLVYAQQLAQQKSEQKRMELSYPMSEKVYAAYQKVLAANNYLLVLKPDAFENVFLGKADNVFEKVARELKIPLPDGLRTQGAAEQQTQASPAARPAGTTKRAPK